MAAMTVATTVWWAESLSRAVARSTVASVSSSKSSSSRPRAAVTARSYHTAGVLAVLMDGSVHLYSNSIDLATWQGLSTRDGGEPVKMP